MTLIFKLSKNMYIERIDHTMYDPITGLNWFAGEEWFVCFKNDIKMPCYLIQGRVYVDTPVMTHYFNEILTESQKDEFEEKLMEEKIMKMEKI